MDLSKVKPFTKNKKNFRRGRGSGSGCGKTAGRGNKGAGQHARKKIPYVGHSGGNLPHWRRLPKRGFSSLKTLEYQIVNLKDIQARLKDALSVTAKELKGANLIKSEKKPVKILADIKDKFSLKATFKVDAVSNKAKSLIEEAGGKIEKKDSQ